MRHDQQSQYKAIGYQTDAQASLARKTLIVFNGGVSREPEVEYGRVVARNVRAIRNRIPDLKQSDLAERMRDLGFDTWHSQTVGTVERGERRLIADEAYGLALALGTTVVALLSPTKDDLAVSVPSGRSLPAVAAASVVSAANYRWVTWDGNKAVFHDKGQADYPSIPHGPLT